MKKDTITVNDRSCAVYTDAAPEYLLIQPADKREIEMADKEIMHIKTLTDAHFAFAAFEITDWNSELSPWEAPPVFGNEPFGSGAGGTLAFVEDTLIPMLTEKYSLNKDIPVMIGGYSLAGLFALWAVYTSERFAAAAAVSPSVWFPEWSEFIGKHSTAAENIYLSLGKKEEKTHNKVMAAVGENIREQYNILYSHGVNVTLEWNEGNHFTEPDIRTAKGFAHCLNAAHKK